MHGFICAIVFVAMILAPAVVATVNAAEMPD